MIDLHIHSQYSDGTLSIKDIFKRAKTNNVSHISITDHQTLNAYLLDDVSILSKKYNIKITPGVEIDCMSLGKYTHILGYGIDVKNTELNNLIKAIFNDGLKADYETIQKMSVDYDSVSLSDFMEYDFDRSNGGWKFINYIFEKGLSSSLLEGTKYYDKYPSEYVRTKYRIDEICQAIHKANGIAVYAHPAFLLDNNSDGIVEHMKYAIKCDIDGIECYHPSISDEVSEVLVEFCKYNQLYITSGSDCHGSFLAESKKSIGAQKHGEFRFIE